MEESSKQLKTDPNVTFFSRTCAARKNEVMNLPIEFLYLEPSPRPMQPLVAKTTFTTVVDRKEDGREASGGRKYDGHRSPNANDRERAESIGIYVRLEP